MSIPPPPGVSTMRTGQPPPHGYQAGQQPQPGQYGLAPQQHPPQNSGGDMQQPNYGHGQPNYGQAQPNYGQGQPQYGAMPTQPQSVQGNVGYGAAPTGYGQGAHPAPAAGQVVGMGTPSSTGHRVQPGAPAPMYDQPPHGASSAGHSGPPSRTSGGSNRRRGGGSSSVPIDTIDAGEVASFSAIFGVDESIVRRAFHDCHNDRDKVMQQLERHNSGGQAQPTDLFSRRPQDTVTGGGGGKVTLQFGSMQAVKGMREIVPHATEAQCITALNEAKGDAAAATGRLMDELPQPSSPPQQQAPAAGGEWGPPRGGPPANDSFGVRQPTEDLATVLKKIEAGNVSEAEKKNQFLKQNFPGATQASIDEAMMLTDNDVDQALLYLQNVKHEKKAGPAGSTPEGFAAPPQHRPQNIAGAVPASGGSSGGQQDKMAQELREHLHNRGGARSGSSGAPAGSFEAFLANEQATSAPVPKPETSHWSVMAPRGTSRADPTTLPLSQLPSVPHQQSSHQITHDEGSAAFVTPPPQPVYPPAAQAISPLAPQTVAPPPPLAVAPPAPQTVAPPPPLAVAPPAPQTVAPPPPSGLPPPPAAKLPPPPANPTAKKAPPAPSTDSPAPPAGLPPPPAAKLPPPPAGKLPPPTGGPKGPGGVPPPTGGPGLPAPSGGPGGKLPLPAPPGGKGALPPPPAPPGKGGLPPPPAPGGLGKLQAAAGKVVQNNKTKSLFWQKIQTDTLDGTIWGQMENQAPGTDDFSVDDLFNKDERTRLEDIFAKKKAEETKMKERGNKAPDTGMLPVLDSNREKNVGIVLQFIRLPINVMSKAIVEFDELTITPDALSGLLSIVPTPEDLKAVAPYVAKKDDPATKSRLSPPVHFFIMASQIEKFGLRLQSWTTKLEFPSFAQDLEDKISIIEAATYALKNSSSFPRVLQTILGVGNHLNMGTSFQNAQAFKISDLEKITTLKTTDNKSTMLQYVVELLERKQPELHGFTKELEPLHAACNLEVSIVQADLQELKKKIQVCANLVKLQQGNPRVVEVLGHFLQGAQPRLDDAEKRFKAAEEDSKSLAGYFGERGSNFKPKELFQNVARFCKTYDETKAKVQAQIARMQRQAAKDAAKGASTSPAASPPPAASPAPPTHHQQAQNFVPAPTPPAADQQDLDDFAMNL